MKTKGDFTAHQSLALVALVRMLSGPLPSLKMPQDGAYVEDEKKKAHRANKARRELWDFYFGNYENPTTPNPTILNYQFAYLEEYSPQGQQRMRADFLIEFRKETAEVCGMSFPMRLILEQHVATFGNVRTWNVARVEFPTVSGEHKFHIHYSL